MDTESETMIQQGEQDGGRPVEPPPATAALEAEQRKAAEAQHKSQEEQYKVEKHAEAAERAAESVGAGDSGFGLMPLIGFSGGDIFNVSRQLVEQAAKQPPLA